MPTPLEVLMDPLSLILIALYFALMTLEALFSARPQPITPYWRTRSLIAYVIYFFVAVYLPMLWDPLLVDYQLFDLKHLSFELSLLISFLVFEFGLYFWHRLLHDSTFLWRTCHQLHHSAERVDIFGAFYFSPLDMVGFTFLGSFCMAFLIGVDPQVMTVFLIGGAFLNMFTHTAIKTPQWLGYFIQRPEGHSVHHGKGIHYKNFSEFSFVDMIFGTWENPKNYQEEQGFYHGASTRIPEMLVFKDVSKPKETE
ncbi:sterol desaturase family protein [Temperatibacter marinus]|uniref:Sterol desaturase family protein n=1 Tax=Temperatibacter marinus TaxID=1456591 RepID=A0AA52EJS3_9PROT|nr:sterol desaturase family protein [Temperatibacter marinus]WND04090.1 sterol desaturase family protein [Temperatibacter marinus]